MSGSPLVVALLLFGIAAGGARGQDLVPLLARGAAPVAGSDWGYPGFVASFGATALFDVTNESQNIELWRTDGTASGTVRLAEMCPPSCSGSIVSLARTASGVFFRHLEAEYPFSSSVWFSDGVAANTRPVATGLKNPTALGWSQVLHSFFFVDTDDAGYRRLWKSDGTKNGTIVMAKFEPGSSLYTSLADFGGRVFFAAFDLKNGPAVWSTNGTAAGTRVFRTLGSAAASYPVPRLIALPHRLVFFANTTTGWRVWSSDGTRKGTGPLTFSDFAPSQFSNLDTLAYPTRIGARIVAVVLTQHGQELLATDGTNEGTGIISDIGPDQPFGQYPYLTAVGDYVVATVDDGIHGRETWTSNGLPEDTRMLDDLCPGPCSGLDESDRYCPDGSGFLFLADSGSGRAIWRATDASSAPQQITGFCGVACVTPTLPGITRIGNRIVLIGGEAIFSLAASPSSPVVTLSPVDFRVFDAIRLSNRLLLSASDPTHGNGLWATNGGVAGTKLLRTFGSTAPN